MLLPTVRTRDESVQTIMTSSAHSHMDDLGEVYLVFGLVPDSTGKIL